MAISRRARIGLAMVIAGLSIQAAAGLLWSPGTFILSAAIGAPLAVVGAVLAWLGIRASAKGSQP